MGEVVKVSREKVDEAIHALTSINSGKGHEIRVPQDDEPVYWQRREWVSWVVQVGKELAADVAQKNSALPPGPGKASDMTCVPSDAITLLKIWQTHLGSCRESCDDAGKLLWDRIHAAIERAQPVCDQQVQSLELAKGV